MASQSDVKEIGQAGAVSSKRRFDARDWTIIGEYVIQEWEQRKSKRRDRERCWDEIDRQIAMEPDIAFKKLPSGQIDTKKAWMAEMELPLQAQALEVLTADARRLLFPTNGPWFRAHVEMTDQYLQKVNFQSLILGDESEVPSEINQDNADKLAEGFLLHLFRQYDFQGRYDLINAEAFKYGMGVGRARMETKNVYIHEARGTRIETQKIPVLVPVSIRHLYLDDPLPSMHSSQVLGPAHIAEDWIKLENLALAANKGSNNPDDPDGGWMPAAVKTLQPTKEGFVQILEMEGDIVVPRKTVRSLVIPGAIVTVAVGGADKGGNVTRSVVRFRFRNVPFSSYLLHPYHFESVDDPYPASPLMKGRPMQIAATDALNRLMDSAALKNQPPVSYDRSDMTFAQQGGPEIYPGALWGTTDPINVHEEIGGDTSALSNVYLQLVSLYAELTGVLPARLGAQTVSHTTAFAKDAELQRGAVRTVDYVSQCGLGPVTRWLDMAYQMGRDSIGNKPISFFIDAYGGFVEVTKEQLAPKASFEWFGSGGPQEEQQKIANKVNSLQLALKMDQINVAYGGSPKVDIASAIRETLREGGWTDLDAIIVREPVPAGPAPGLPGIGQGTAGPVTAAVQSLVAGQGQ